VRTAVTAVTLTCLTLLGCSRSNAEQQLLKDTSAAADWVPALQMTAEKWAANSVPRRFVRSAAEAAGKELNKTLETIRKSNADGELRQRLERDFREAGEIASVLQAAAEKGDPRIVTSRLRDLQRLHQDLESLDERYGGGS
jgi:hypothetical protein